MRSKLLGWWIVVMVIIAGCSGRPARVHVPRYNAQQIGTQAIELLDTDGDGLLSSAERTKAPSLEMAMRRLDTDGDGQLSAEEIAARIAFYHEYKAGLVPVNCTLAKGGGPVVGAEVTFEPEPFMGEAAIPGFGTTGEGGGTVITMTDEHLPSPAHAGVQPGFYRLRVTLADGTEVTELNAGAEVAGDLMNTLNFSLP